MQIPLLLLSDAPDQSSGLARITRDLATMMQAFLDTPQAEVAQGVS